MDSFHVQQNLIELCNIFNIHIIAYCSFGPQS